MTRQNFTSGLLGGVTAAVIWMAITLWTGWPTQTIGLWALVILIGTTIVATILASVIWRAATDTVQH